MSVDEIVVLVLSVLLPGREKQFYGAVLCAPVKEGLIRDPKECATYLALDLPNLRAQITPFSLCVRGSTYMHICSRVCMCTWSPGVKVECLPLSFSTLFLETGSLTESEAS